MALRQEEETYPSTAEIQDSVARSGNVSDRCYDALDLMLLVFCSACVKLTYNADGQRVKVYLCPKNIFFAMRMGTQFRSQLHQSSEKNVHQVMK